jgi:hypothetical protein
VFVWGKDGVLGIHPFNSSILSATILLLIESTLFSIGLYTGKPDIVPKKFVNNVVILQFMIHIILGIFMGLFYEMLPI